MTVFTGEERQNYKAVDRVFLEYDKEALLRTKNLRLIPNEPFRRGGKYSYAEWAFTIGIFQTVLNFHLIRKENNFILDVGCGTGLMCIAAEPFLGSRGHCVGIDAIKSNIHFCRENFPEDKFTFFHPDRRSPENRMLWDVEDRTFDVITALSVWTHFGEETAMYYFKEVNRMLKPGGIAIISFFFLDSIYADGLNMRNSNEIGRYHSTKQGVWVFSERVRNSDSWLCPSWVKRPEQAIGVTPEGMREMIYESPDLRMVEMGYYPGNWKEHPGIFFQDVFVFEKCFKAGEKDGITFNG